MTHNVAKITTPDGAFYTARSDNRTPEEVVAVGISGYQAGNRAPIFKSLFRWKTCHVENIATGLTKETAENYKKVLIEVTREQGLNVLNVWGAKSCAI